MAQALKQLPRSGTSARWSDFRAHTWPPTQLSGLPLIENVYAPDGRRVLTRKGAQTIRFLHSGWQVLEERNGSDAVLRQYVTGVALDDHVQMTDIPTGQTYYYHSNSQGFVGALTNAAGLPVEMYEYSWLGRPAVYDLAQPGLPKSASTVGNPYLFQGRRWEPELQLYDFRHRWYSPSSGEFLSLDPSGVWRHGMGNGYDAFGGDPWNHADPLGLYPFRGTASAVGRWWRDVKGSFTDPYALAIADEALEHYGASMGGPASMAAPDAIGDAFLDYGVNAAFGGYEPDEISEEIRDITGKALLAGDLATAATGLVSGGRALLCKAGKLRNLDELANARHRMDDVLNSPIPIEYADDAARGGPTKGLQKQLDKHVKKLEDYKADPDAFDNKGFLKDASPELREKIIDGRIRNLEKQIENFRKQIDEAGGGG